MTGDDTVTGDDVGARDDVLPGGGSGTGGIGATGDAAPPPPGTAPAGGRDSGPTGPAGPTVPRPRRSNPAGRGPLGPAGSGPGSRGHRPGTTRRGPVPAGRGPARTVPLPTVGAQRRAQESRPHLWFAHQLVLTLSGQRPVHALLGHALPAAYDRLAELAPQAPLRPVLGPGRRGPVPTVRECGLCRPRRGVIEAFARITTGERLRALAFRLELGADSRWRCAALDIGPAPALPGPAS
ncbi:Rv3235 family protein [Streptomyces sp. NRRL S-337]|uniref:Rv3235 family protein n=1 Tax=Streptomyces sp. NRRL S-337 TaxID=1463900 RepID=UPI000A5C2CC9|nr:Rv3235 family protein [Streptomyces sp. NRRL S-337]